MEYFLLAIIIALVVWMAIKPKANTAKSNEGNDETQNTKESLDFKNGYQQKWLFSINEKNAYKVLKPITDKLGLHLFTKVRLLDLLEPKKGNPKYKTFFYKVQAKHVDFVVCTSNLVAKCIIELDDASHDTKKRQQRDGFVNEIVQSVGYKIIHTRGINAESMEAQLTEIFKEKKQED